MTTTRRRREAKAQGATETHREYLSAYLSDQLRNALDEMSWRRRVRRGPLLRTIILEAVQEWQRGLADDDEWKSSVFPEMSE